MTTIVDNYIGGKVVPPCSGAEPPQLKKTKPTTSSVVGKVALPNTADVDAAVDADAAARCHRILECHDEQSLAAIMLEFHSIVHSNANELARLIVLENENGKIIAEALADVAKGNEMVE